MNFSNNSICDKVIFSNRAYSAIIAETFERISTETGGILLGQKINNKWYVIEAVDPGPNSIFSPSYFEYDTLYVNHLANKIARLYTEKIEALGLWHRHPGSLDQFSALDHETNRKYAEDKSYGAISGLVNIDPHFRLTIYHVSIPIAYTKLNFEVGDDKIPEYLLKLKHINNILPNSNEMPDNQSLQDKEYNKQRDFFSWMHDMINPLIAPILKPQDENQSTAINHNANLISELKDSSNNQIQIANQREKIVDFFLDDIEYVTDMFELEKYTLETTNFQPDKIILIFKYHGTCLYLQAYIECIFSCIQDSKYIKINNWTNVLYTSSILYSYVEQFCKSLNS